jgi:NAD dependent epimerase/dehydratase family enzyme
MMMGEMADLVIYGQRVVPKRLQESGYEFIYQDISQAFDCLRK